MLVRNECDELRGERDKEGERFFAPTGEIGWMDAFLPIDYNN